MREYPTPRKTVALSRFYAVSCENGAKPPPHKTEKSPLDPVQLERNLPLLRAVHCAPDHWADVLHRSEEHTSELQSLMRISYAVFCLTKKNKNTKSNKQK